MDTVLLIKDNGKILKKNFQKFNQKCGKLTSHKNSYLKILKLKV